jgi:hypothetical protein
MPSEFQQIKMCTLDTVKQGTQIVKDLLEPEGVVRQRLFNKLYLLGVQISNRTCETEVYA